MCKDEKSCITINCGCCGTGTGGDRTPVGTVISYMGTKAPDHYLVCDGAIYNIADYEGFSQFIKDEYGSLDFFGGDGTTTFAVPDLRGEFLRGAGTGTRDTGTGTEVGTHQDGTYVPNIWIYGNGGETNTLAADIKSKGEVNSIKNTDKLYSNNGTRVCKSISPYEVWDTMSGTTPYGYTSRPTNTAVLYCIKYE